MANMRHFIDDNGLFEVKIPITWKYSLRDGKIHTFQEFEAWKFDAFQISLRKTSDSINIKNFKHLTPVTFGRNSCYCLPDSTNENFTIKSWVSLIEDMIVFFTLTFSLDPVDETPLSKKIDIVNEIIKEFRIIKETEKESKVNSYRFELFIQGVGATSAILNKAVKNKAFIESTCIIANQIDALLRIGIVLKKQILNNSIEIEQEWIYQGLTDKIKSEKDIYASAKDLGIISEDIYKKLYLLYDDRNRVIHRFIISEITIAEIENIAFNYYKVQEQINQIIYDLESEQISLNIGMTRNSSNSSDSQEEFIEYIKGKIGKQDYFEENPVDNNT
jgi:hypothetical protein